MYYGPSYPFQNHSDRRIDAERWVKFRDRVTLSLTRTSPVDSKLDCFALCGEQTSQHLRDRFQLGLTQAAVDAYLDRLIVSSIGSSWTRLYDSVSCREPIRNDAGTEV